MEKSFEDVRGECVDGLLMSVITKRSSAGCVTTDFRFGSGILRNDDRLFFGLFDIANDDVDEAGDGVDEFDFAVADSGVRS